jgi:hypothetical protein
VTEFFLQPEQVGVPRDEYVRLLGYPRGWQLEERAEELVAEAVAWYASHGRPWIYGRLACQIPQASHEDAILLDGAAYVSSRLRRALDRGGADEAALVAVSAGPELEEEAQRRWRDARPDEYYFLEAYGAAVVERLLVLAQAQICAWAEGQSLAVLPHVSPGYGDWEVGDQRRLLASLRSGGAAWPCDFECLDSGMLRPKKSQLAVFPLTHEVESARRQSQLSPCRQCALADCQFRRMQYKSPPPAPHEFAAAIARAGRASSAAAPLTLEATYSTARKALARWSKERLVLTAGPDGACEARFRYEGTTCSNLGHPLSFDYYVSLGAREQGFPIRQATCRPADGDVGHRRMCSYLRVGERILADSAEPPPLVGRPLDEVLAWRRSSAPAGCYCDQLSRLHKWGLVLETIHFALAQREIAARGDNTDITAA